VGVGALAGAGTFELSVRVRGDMVAVIAVCANVRRARAA
jgi:hypothetical protein